MPVPSFEPPQTDLSKFAVTPFFPAAFKNLLSTIEANLNARAITPKKYRAELIRHVHPPLLEKIVHIENVLPPPPALQALKDAEYKMDLKQDPYVKQLLENGDEDSEFRLEKIRSGKKTFCVEQMTAFCRSSRYVYEELGGWAANWYIWNCLQNFRDMVDENEEPLSEWTTAENLYMLELLQDVHSCIPDPYEAAQVDVSPKVQCLVDFLAREASPAFRGLVFVKQRATVAALAEVLAINPDIKGLFKLGTFVGTSTSVKRKFKFSDKVDLREQQQSLADFRSGRKNLILGTSVLEEGIDIVACNSVTCFETPENLKSYIQRRGRARMQGSKYAIFLTDSSIRKNPDKWQALEEDMRAAYMDELREMKALSYLEESEQDDGRTFQVEQTGALLTMENALQHLNHFCAKLATAAYVDPRPQFTRVTGAHAEGVIRMDVILPSTLEPHLRTATSLKSWESEKLARKDAAFEAYLRLYRAGLVNDNLLPLDTPDPDASLTMDSTSTDPAIVSVPGLIDPWKRAISLQPVSSQRKKLWCKYLITITLSQQEPFQMIMFLPGDLSEPADINLYWNEIVCHTAHLEMLGVVEIADDDFDHLRKFTKLLLLSVFRTRMTLEREDFVAFFAPTDQEALDRLLQDFTGQKPASEVQGISPTQAGLVRDIGSPGRPLIFRGFRMGYATSSEGLNYSGMEPELLVEFTKFPKRRDFLHPLPTGDSLSVSYTSVDTLPACDCTVDNLPNRYSVFAVFVPSILHRCGLRFVARTLCEGVLRPVEMNDLGLVQAAITASSAREDIDYQRLEFLGDGILKCYTAIRLFYELPDYPERYLAGAKDRRVANDTLANVALENDLGRYIITIPFTGYKWQPLYTEDSFEHEEEERRELSRKIIADVVEALIGAAYIDGGWTKAQKCIEIFFPSTTNTLIVDQPSLAPTVDEVRPFPPLAKLEELIGYRFTNQFFLIEALTHASFTLQPDARSYERLEYIGDAILDYIITPRLYRYYQGRSLKHYEMHLLRIAVVNADFLAFCCMTNYVTEDRADIVRDHTTPSGFATQHGTVKRHLWQYMRKSSPEITKAQDASIKRYLRRRDDVRRLLERGQRYPWIELMHIRADKFFSDLVESVIGAIFLDSGHDLQACERFVEKMGLFRVMDRLIADGVDVMHPKERLGVLAVSRVVKYNIRFKNGIYYCSVKVGNREVATGEGHLAEVARIDAATHAVRIMQGR